MLRPGHDRDVFFSCAVLIAIKNFQTQFRSRFIFSKPDHDRDRNFYSMKMARLWNSIHSEDTGFGGAVFHGTDRKTIAIYFFQTRF
jgi:hypothetical protein